MITDTTVTELRRRVSIAGIVTEAQSGARVPGALVEIVSGPEAFERRRAARVAYGGAPRDRQAARTDGSYVLVDLPPGTYTLRVGDPRRPELTAETTVRVAAPKPGARPERPDANLALATAGSTASPKRQAKQKEK